MSGLLILFLLIPLAGIGAAFFVRRGSVMFMLSLGAVLLDALCLLVGSFGLPTCLPMQTAGGWLYLDHLSAWHLLVMLLVFTAGSLFAPVYFRDDLGSGRLSLAAARRYNQLWLGSLWTMTLTLLANNIGLMWVGMEATTLVTAFLVSISPKPAAIEAMWKYLIICSVGIAFAFIGILLVAASLPATGEGSQQLFWTQLSVAGGYNLLLLKAAFLFSLVGFGTKAGLAPMHTWLPDAHSQAPGPVSAMFSGFMLNAALYCIMRHGAIVNHALGSDQFTCRLYILFGLVSIVVSAAFIIYQRDIKRLLAYHSVEHLGIITLGLGLGPAGCFAALLHTLNHSLCKSLSFFAAGRLGQLYGSHEMGRIRGALHSAPLWGIALVVSLLALIGVAPFSIFISEFLLVKAAIDRGAIIALMIFLLASGVVFVAALEHVIPMAWGEKKALAGKHCSLSAVTVVMLLVALLLFFGLSLPAPIQNFLTRAAALAGGLS